MVVRDFLLIEEIGRGGMGTVWKAEQRQPRRHVAIKFVPLGEESDGDRRWSRFELEASGLASLRHPAVATFHLSGVEHIGGHRVGYLVMELLERAEHVVRYLHISGLSLRERIALLADMCDGVGAAHAIGLVHRDIKPANVLVDDQGRVRVIDFGVARAVAGPLHRTAMQTEAGRVIGTPQYMSPEQVGGEPAQVGTRSDVYSLGLVIFESLAGRPPYDIGGLGPMQAMRVVCEMPPERLGAANPACRGDLDAVVGRALAKDPSQRYASASELGDDLRRVLKGEPVLARPLTPAYQLATIVRRHPAASAAGAIALVTFAVLGIIAMAQREKAQALNDRLSLVASAYAIEGGSFGYARSTLNQVRPRARDWLWRALARSAGPVSVGVLGDHAVRPRMEPFPDFVYAIAGFGDGTRGYVVARETLLEFKIDAAGAGVSIEREILIDIPESGSDGRPEALSVDTPSGGEIVAMSYTLNLGRPPYGIVQVCDPSTGEVLFRTEAGFSPPVCLDREGSLLCTSSPDEGLRVLKTADWSDRYAAIGLGRDRDILARIAISDDGRHAVAGFESGWCAVVDLDEGRVAAMDRVASSRILSLQFSRDGRSFLVGTADGHIRRCDVDDCSIIGERDLRSPVRGIAPFDSERRLAVVCQDNQLHMLRPEDLTPVMSFPASLDEAWCLLVPEAGRVALVGERGLQAMRLPQPILPFRPAHASLSATGRWIAAIDFSGGVMMFEVSAFDELIQRASIHSQAKATAVSICDSGGDATVAILREDGTLAVVERTNGEFEVREVISRAPESLAEAKALRPDSALLLLGKTRQVVIGDPDGRLRLVELDTGEVQRAEPEGLGLSINRDFGIVSIVAAGDPSVNAFAVAAVQRHELSLWRSGPGPSLKQLQSTRMSPLGAIAANGRKLFSGTRTGLVYCHDLNSLRERWRRQVLSDGAIVMAAHPDGRLLAVADRSALWMVEAETGPPMLQLARLESPPVACVFCRDPDRLVLLDENGRLWTWNGDSELPHALPSLPATPDEESNR